MTSIVTDFKSIKKILNRQEQKADFEAKNPKVEQSAYEAMTGGMFGIGSPLKSLAHPEWPYQGTGFEWAKFVRGASNGAVGGAPRCKREPADLQVFVDKFDLASFQKEAEGWEVVESDCLTWPQVKI